MPDISYDMEKTQRFFNNFLKKNKNPKFWPGRILIMVDFWSLGVTVCNLGRSFIVKFFWLEFGRGLLWYCKVSLVTKMSTCLAYVAQLLADILPTPIS